MLKAVLERSMAELGLSIQARRWLLDLWDVIQGLDDWRDGDPVDAEEIEATIHKCLFDLWANPFFSANASILLPLLSSMVLRWSGANRMEAEKVDLPKAYMWRAAYYDLILQAVAIERGASVAQRSAHLVASIYGETLDEFVKEFQDA